MQEICTLGSAWGDEFKKPRALGEGTGAKASDNSEAPQRATASKARLYHPPNLSFRYTQGLFLFTCERPTIVSRAGVVVALAKQWGCSAEAMRGRCYSRSGVHSSYPPERCTTPLKEPLLIRTHPVQGLAPAQTCL